MSLNGYLTRKEFNEDIIEIFKKFSNLHDLTWKLVKHSQSYDSTTSQFKFNNEYIVIKDNLEIRNNDIFYLEKTSKKFLQIDYNEIITFVYHVIFSESYSVPVLYLNGKFICEAFFHFIYALK
jgi:hypothetical protein